MKVFYLTKKMVKPKNRPVFLKLIEICHQKSITIFQAFENDFSDIYSSTFESIEESDIVVCDLMDDNSSKYEFEIGYALGKGKYVILISNRVDNVSGDLRMCYLISAELPMKLVEFKLKSSLSSILNEKNLELYNPLIPTGSRFQMPSDSLYFLANNPLSKILDLKGVEKFLKLEEWVYYMFKSIPGIIIEKAVPKVGSNDSGFDLSLVNDPSISKLDLLHRQSLIEIKATNILRSDTIIKMAHLSKSYKVNNFIIFTTGKIPKSIEKLRIDFKNDGIDFMIINLNRMKDVDGPGAFISELNAVSLNVPF